MIGMKMEEAINKQINEELYSSYLYVAMAGYFANINLNGFANWMRIQALEERFHATKMFDFLISRGGRIRLESIETPPSEWESPLIAFEEVLKHEEHITSKINEIVDLAVKEKDHASHIFYQWYVTEQVEEEETASGIIQQLKLTGENGSGLFMIDKELLARTFTPPVDSAGNSINLI